MNLSPVEIARCLAEAPRSSPRTLSPTEFLDGERRRAAILIPFLKVNQAWHLLFIRRTVNDHDRHAGQVAFPGGGLDPGDQNPEAGALREANEEVGIDPADVRILGKMGDFISITNYQVTPVVGVIPWPYPLRLDPVEVSRAFTIPLEWLADPANHETRPRTIPHHDPFPVIYFQPYDGEVLWGFSASVVLHLLSVLS